VTKANIFTRSVTMMYASVDSSYEQSTKAKYRILNKCTDRNRKAYKFK